jgi:ABC-2 type transport system permease protein
MQGTRPFSSWLGHLGGRGGKVTRIVVTALMACSLAFFEFLFGMNYYTYQTLGMLLDLPDLGMFVACMAGFLFLFVFSASNISSIVYRGTDEPMVMSLPVTERELVTSRFLIAYLIDLPVYAMVVLPAVVVSVLVDGLTPWIVVGGIALLATGPLVPLSLGLLVSALAIRIGKGRRHVLGEQLVFFLVFLGMVIFMTGNFTKNLAPDGSVAIDYQAMLASSGERLRGLYRVFVLFVAQGRMVFDPRYLLAVVAGTMVLSWAIPAAISRNFNRAFSMARNGAARNGKRRVPTRSAGTGIIRSLMGRELCCIRSSSAFVFELAGELFIPVILLVVYGLTGVLSDIQETVGTISSSPYLPFGIFALFALFSNINMLSATSISRQGSLFDLDRTVPVPPERFVEAKLLFHLLAVFPLNVVYLAISVSYFGMGFSALLWMAPLSLLSIVSCAALGLSLDYRRPLLDWTLARQAVKNNSNGMLSMLFSFLVILCVTVLLVGPSYLGYGTVPGVVLAYAALSVFSVRAVRSCVRQARSALGPR